MATRNPAEHIHLLRVGQAVCDGVGNNLQQGVGAEVLEVVDVVLHLDAVHAADILDVFLVECELDVRLAELDLFEARCGIGMEEAGVSVRERTPLPSPPGTLGRLWTCPRSRKSGPARATRPKECL